MLIFALFLPLLKMGLVAVVSNTTARTHPRLHRAVHWLAWCGKWSMLEVFIVAILVVVGQVHSLTTVEVHAGLYALAASVLLVHLATCRLDARLQPRAEDQATRRTAVHTADGAAERGTSAGDGRGS